MRIGRYQISSPIGDGGVGSVFRAIDTRLGRAVALKFLHPRWNDHPGIRARFEREAAIGAALDHPNLCTVHDLREIDGHLFIVMELLIGDTLSTRIPPRGLPATEVIGVGRQVAAALAAAHERGLVHRDVKPANVFVTSEGTVKLLDFGLAKTATDGKEARVSADQNTDPGGDSLNGRLVGTVGYMSPEQACGAGTDGRSDLFSLGVVLYEAATAVQPFAAPDAAAAFDLVLSFDPPPPSSVKRSLPGGLNRLVRRALRKSPGARFQTAREMLEELGLLSRPAERRPRAQARVPGRFLATLLAGSQ